MKTPDMDDHANCPASGEAAALTIGAPDAPPVRPSLPGRLAEAAAQRVGAVRGSVAHLFDRIDFAPDLAQDIGSRKWFRGLGTFLGLSALSLAFWPDFAPLEAAPAMRIDTSARDEYRSQMIMPLALGGDSGRRMGATPIVVPLASAPERPQIELLATLHDGDSLVHVLRRAGVSSGDATRVEELVTRAMPLAEIDPGTQLQITLGRRPASDAPRPLDSLSFRARFDLELDVERSGGTLALQRVPIRVDDTPLRIRGTVGDSLYRSARAAGAPAKVVQEYLKALSDQIDINSDIRATDTFDMIVAYRRAATGERQAGKLIYAGIDRGSAPRTQLMRWGKDGRFYEASGVGEQRSGLVAPVPGRTTSGFGMRRHPILGYRRMHSGLDFKARYSTPIVAVTDGQVSGAGRMGGCGNAVRLNHAGGLQTRYCHMSRIAVNRGQSVRRGQVIGYVGSTGLSTGAHLHYEMYRGGRAINPATVNFVTRAQLSGQELQQFRESLKTIRQVEAGAALADLELQPNEVAGPKREIERAEQPRSIG